MQIKMLNTSIIMNYRYEYDENGEATTYRNYDTEFIVKAEENTTMMQIDSLLTSFCHLKDTHSAGEMYYDKRMITLDKASEKGIFTARLSLYNAICFDEFMCMTDDFKSFDWYARQIQIEEKSEDFKPIN